MRRAAQLLLHIGIVVTVFALGKSHAVMHHYDYTESLRFVWSLGFMATLSLAAYGVGLPDLAGRQKEAFFSSLKACAVTAVAVSLIQLFSGDGLLPRFLVFGSVIVLTPWFTMCARISSSGHTRAQARDRVIVVADHAGHKALLEDSARAPERPLQLLGGMNIVDARGDGSLSSPLIEEVHRLKATVVVLDRSALLEEGIIEQAGALHQEGIRVRTLSLFYEEWLGMLPASELERVSLMFDIGELHRARYGRVKRLLDATFGALAVIVMVVLLIPIKLGNLVANRGPLFYRQERVGKNGSTFQIVKFRTMHTSDGAQANEWTSEGDPRITSWGRILRKTHIDELPQALNVLRGDISLVGPRPEQPRYVERLSEALPFYALRHLVSPGLTGWAQIKYGYAGNERDALQKLQYDFYYLRHQGLRLDLTITGRTIRTLLGFKGR